MLVSELNYAMPNVAGAASIQNHCPELPVLGNTDFCEDWSNLLAGNLPAAYSVAIIDLATTNRAPWEIFGCDSCQLFVLKPLQGKLSEKDLGALESVALLEGLRTIVILVDASSSIVPPPGYERLIWHIDPEYCGRQRQQALLQETSVALGRSHCLQKMWFHQHLEILTATYHHQTGALALGAALAATASTQKN
jgi:hypothetical protein